MINDENNLNNNNIKPRKKPKYRTINSYGIAAFRKNNNKYELLLVKKRYTRAFSQFVRGFYKTNEEVISLCNQMTQDEKLTILCGDFNMIYYKMFMMGPPNIPRKFMRSYRNYKYIYDKKWSNNIELLRKLAHGTINREGLWEFPKGRRDKGENILTCALREFSEETGIKSSLLKNITSKPIAKFVNYKSGEIKFVSHLFIASMNFIEQTPHYFINGPPQFCECQLMKWCDYNTCKELIRNKSMINTIKIIFNYIKKLNGGKQLYSFPTPVIETKSEKMRKRNWNTLR